jgi:SMI1 / KNR4 family (SUKH-1)
MNNKIHDIEKALGVQLPGAYRNFLLQEHLTADRAVSDLLLLYGTGSLPERNTTYEVQKYLPDYISIGDDSGGQAICLHCNGNDHTVYITGYGALDTGSMAVLSDHFTTWIQHGCSLNILRESPDLLALRASDTFSLSAAYQELHRTLTQLEAAKTNGMDLKTYLTQKRVLQQQLKDFEIQHAGKKYRI